MKKIVVLVCFCLLGVACMGVASDGNFGKNVVTNNNDSGVGSLRYVVENAKPGSTIKFHLPVTKDPDCRIIKLRSDILLAKNITIDGRSLVKSPSVPNITIDGGKVTRIFDVSKYLRDDDYATIKNLKITNGLAELGGGIYNEGNLKVENCVITNNTATKSGGGIYNVGANGNDAHLIITGSTITENISLNPADKASGNEVHATGGGITNQSHDNSFTITTLKNSFVTKNKAYGSGGGICNISYSPNTKTVVKLLNTKVTGNETPNSGKYSDSYCGGGGIYNNTWFGRHGQKYQSITKVILKKGSIISGNITGGKGGGINNNGYLTPAELKVSADSKVINNHAVEGIGNDIYTPTSPIVPNI